MRANTNYVAVNACAIPATVRWDTPRSHQGQIVEISYSDARPGRGEGGVGDDYQRTIDRSDRSTSYARRIGPRWTV